MDDAEKFERRIATVIDRFDDKVALEAMEMSLQLAAQDLREQRDVEDGQKRA